MESQVRRLRYLVAGLAPFIVAVILSMLMAVPLQLPHVGAVTPSLTLAAVFYWAVFRPDLFGYAAAFFLGLISDIVTGGPLGLGALVLVVAQAISVTQRRFFLHKPFHILWWGFALIAPLAMLLRWLLGSIYMGSFLAITPVILQAIVTIAIFPAVAWLLGRCHALLPRMAGNTAAS